MLVTAPNEKTLEPRIVSMGTCRVLRVKQVGAVFFVENDVGHMNDKGEREEEWKPCAVSKGPDAYKESHQFLADSNIKVLRMMAEDRKRAEHRATPSMPRV